MKYREITIWLVILTVGVLAVSCANTSPYINMRYQPPPPSELLKSKAVFFQLKDNRIDKTILGPGAKHYFRNFSGYFTLYIAEENMKDEMVGGHNVESLFKMALTTRLETMGVNVININQREAPVLELILEKFYLDYRFKEWRTDISLQINLIKDKITATDKVRITGTRTKDFGYGNVENFLSEIFSDSLNKLDIAKLFVKVGL